MQDYSVPNYQKQLFKFKVHLSNVCRIISLNPLFEIVTILVIIFNSYLFFYFRIMLATDDPLAASTDF